MILLYSLHAIILNVISVTGLFRDDYVSLAQLVEHRTFNPRVMGPRPIRNIAIIFM